MRWDALDRWTPVIAVAAAAVIVVAYIAWVRTLVEGSILPLAGALVVGALMVVDTALGALEERTAWRRASLWKAVSGPR